MLSVVRLNVIMLSAVAADPIFRAEHKKVLQTLSLILYKTKKRARYKHSSLLCLFKSF